MLVYVMTLKSSIQEVKREVRKLIATDMKPRVQVKDIYRRNWVFPFAPRHEGEKFLSVNLNNSFSG